MSLTSTGLGVPVDDIDFPQNDRRAPRPSSDEKSLTVGGVRRFLIERIEYDTGMPMAMAGNAQCSSVVIMSLARETGRRREAPPLASCLPQSHLNRNSA